MMAIPGEVACREVAPCGTGTWGDIPIDGTTQFVDRSYLGGGSDGTQAKPWLTLQAGIDAAASGAIVAIAAGSYVEDVVIDQPLQLWGRCPAQVEIAGATAASTVSILPGADGAEVRDLAVTGPGTGILVAGSDGVQLARLWIHDTGARGIRTDLIAAQVTGAVVLDSLVETARDQGISVRGATTTVDRTVVRDTRPSAADYDGRGISVTDDSGSGTRSEVVVRRSLIDGNRTCGVIGFGSDLTLEDTVVRDTLPQVVDGLFGNGVMVFRSEAAGLRGHLVVTGSVVMTSRGGGVSAVDSELLIDRSVVQDTASRAADGLNGDGVVILGAEPTEPHRPVAQIVASVIERNHRIGVVASGAELTVESTIVRDTVGQAADSLGGNGVYLDASQHTGEVSALSMVGALLDGNLEAAVLVLGSTADIDLSWIRDTSPCAVTGRFGRGVTIQWSAATLDPASGSLRRSLVEGSHEAAIFVMGADLTLEDVVIRDTAPQPAAGLYGDGLLLLAHPETSGVVPTRATVSRCAIHGSPRAGLANFGGSVAIGGSDLQCNAIDFDGESVMNDPFEFTDEGGNVCGCDGAHYPCQVLSTDIAPPDPAPP